MDIIFVPLLSVIVRLIDLYQMLLFVYVIMSWLEAFNVINTYNRFVYALNNFLFRLIEPALGPLRRIVPSMGGVDLSPLALLFGLYFVQGVLIKIISRFPS